MLIICNYSIVDEEDDGLPYRVLCDVSTSTDDLYMDSKEVADLSGYKFETPVWDQYVRDCWQRAQTGTK